MGEIGSTTAAIENELYAWIEDDINNRLSRWIEPLDHSHLKQYEQEIVDTLERREGRGLTYSIFPETMRRSPPRLIEGALRRSLTSIYVDHYTSGYDAHIVWGIDGTDYYEKADLRTGLNLKFATFVLEETGLFSELRKKPNFGLRDRIACDKSAELARFRSAYLVLSATFDEALNQCNGHFEKRSFIDVTIANLRSVGALKLKSSHAESPNLLDIIARAADRLNEAAGRTKNPASVVPNLIITSQVFNGPRLARASKVRPATLERAEGTAGTDQPKIKTIIQAPEPATLFDWWYVVSGLIGMAGTVACFSVLSAYSGLTWPAILSVSLIAGVIAFGISAFFNRRFYHRRFITMLMVPTIMSSLGFRLEIGGSGDMLGGYISSGKPVNTAVVICGSILIFVALMIDFSKNR